MIPTDCSVRCTPTIKELENIKKYIDQRCEGLLDVEIKIVHEVQHTPRGKYIWAICNVEQ